jgi:uncharacterized membrane protein YbhN (UPF0104 family)
MRLLQVAVAILLLAGLWHIADGARALDLLGRADPVWLVAAFAALTLQTSLTAMRWRLTAAQLGLVLNKRVALREYYLSQVVNQILPGGVLGDAGRALRTRGPAGLMAAGQAVVFERLAGQIALAAVLVSGIAATALVPGGLDWPNWALWSLVGLIAVVGVTVGLVRRGQHLLPGRVRLAMQRQGAAFGQAIAAPDVALRQVVLSLCAVICNIAAFGFCARAVGADLPVPTLLALIPLILLAMIVPLTISGWGLREGAAAALFGLAGATPSDGLAASIAFGLVFLASVVPGGVLMVATQWRVSEDAPRV